MNHKIYLILILSLLLQLKVKCQDVTPSTSKVGWFSLGGRSTISAFSDDGAGLGTGGQFRIQLSDKVNTDWFADYITIGMKDGIRSVYYHIGWSVLFYPLNNHHYPKLIQPYILAGHCFDYNEKSLINNPSVSAKRWGSAVQTGIGTHVNLSEKFDISLTTQFMIHLTNELEVEKQNGEIIIQKNSTNSLEGHLLTTASMNYKIFKMWKK